jgi:hypothetical protein
MTRMTEFVSHPTAFHLSHFSWDAACNHWPHDLHTCALVAPERKGGRNQHHLVEWLITAHGALLLLLLLLLLPSPCGCWTAVVLRIHTTQCVDCVL